MEGTLAEIRLFAGPWVPKYWAACNGTTYAINQNQALFSLLGTTYGGNGVTTFCIPDFRGRAGLGCGNFGQTMGQMGGTDNVTINAQTMPAHVHASALEKSPVMKVVSAAATLETPNAGTSSFAAEIAQSARQADQYLAYNTTDPNIVLNSGSTVTTVSESPVGGSQPHENRQPGLGLWIIICMQGIYPSRN